MEGVLTWLMGLSPGSSRMDVLSSAKSRKRYPTECDVEDWLVEGKWELFERTMR